MSGLLFLAPALALALLMVARRYPFERRIAAISAGRRSNARRAPKTVRAGSARRRVAVRPRGGALIALSLATRPPPAITAS